MVVVGITGGLGTGKSTVARMFGELGARVIDADRLAHEVMTPRRAAWRRIRARFGARVLRPDGTVNRQALGALVFRDATARRALEAIVHPQVFREIRRRLRQARQLRRAQVVVVEVPLLIEANAQSLVDVLVVVTAPVSAQVRRLAQRGMVKEEMGRRVTAQMALSAKVALADSVIDNSDGLTATRRQVKQLWKHLADRKHQPRG